jgi:hypothetical protein
MHGEVARAYSCSFDYKTSYDLQVDQKRKVREILDKESTVLFSMEGTCYTIAARKYCTVFGTVA